MFCLPSLRYKCFLLPTDKRSTSSVSIKSMHSFIAFWYRGVETYFLVIFFSLRQVNQFGNHNDLYVSRRQNKVFLFFYMRNTASKIILDIHLGPVINAVGTCCQIQPGILEAPAVYGSEEWLYLQQKLSSTVPQFLFLTLLSFTPSARKFTFEKYFPASPISWTAESFL